MTLSSSSPRLPALNPDEIEMVEKQGIPLTLATAYLTVGPARSVLLTPRGWALYEYAINRYRIPYDLNQIQVVRDVTRLNILLVDARAKELAAVLRGLPASSSVH